MIGSVQRIIKKIPFFSLYLCCVSAVHKAQAEPRVSYILEDRGYQPEKDVEHREKERKGQMKGSRRATNRDG